MYTPYLIGEEFKKLCKQINFSITKTNFYIGLILSSLIINLLSLAFPLLLLQIYDRIIPNNSVTTLFLLVLAVLSALIVEALIRVARTWMASWEDARFEHLTSCSLVNKIIHAKIKDYEVMGTGAYIENVNSVQILKDFFGSQVITSLLDLPFIFIFLTLIYIIAGWLVLIPAIVLVFFTLSTLHLGKKLSNLYATKRITDDRRLNFIIDILSSIHTIKSMSFEHQIQRRYEKIQDDSSFIDYYLTIRNSHSTLISNLSTQLTTILILAFGSMMVINHQLTIGGLSACVLLANRTLQPIGKAIGVWARFQLVKIAFDRIKIINQLPQEDTTHLPEMPRIHDEIDLKNVSFRYTDKSDWLFKDINLKINSGEIVGIKSEGLSGKSSLLWIIMGILSPTEGEVLIDDKNIQDYNSKSVRKQISYIPQRGVLLNGTILDNLTLFRPEYVEKAKKISESLGLNRDIQQLPKGYLTEVGKQTVDTIPQGLKQRICIARALIDQPRIILFDEANMTMDKRSDSIFKSTLIQYKKQATWVLVSHRPSILELADRVFSIREGELKEVKS